MNDNIINVFINEDNILQTTDLLAEHFLPRANERLADHSVGSYV